MMSGTPKPGGPAARVAVGAALAVVASVTAAPAGAAGLTAAGPDASGWIGGAPGLGHAAAVRASTMAGTTSDTGLPVVAHVARGRRTVTFIVEWRHQCQQALAPGWSGFKSLRFTRAGQFRFVGTRRVPLDDGSFMRQAITLRGRIVRGTARGTFRLVTEVFGADGNRIDACDTGALTWSARDALTYGGQTRQGDPLILRLNRARTRLAAFQVPWTAPCGDGMWFDSTTLAGSLSGGRFRGTVTDTSDVGEGRRAEKTITFADTVGRTRASGTWRATVRILGPDGSVLTTCDTGALVWSARD